MVLRIFCIFCRFGVKNAGFLSLRALSTSALLGAFRATLAGVTHAHTRRPSPCAVLQGPECVMRWPVLLLALSTL